MDRLSIIRHIKALKKPATASADWLLEDRKKLIEFMRLHPDVGRLHAARKGAGLFKLIHAGGIAVIVVALATTSVTFAAQNAVPGEILFPLKKISERAALAIPFSADARSAIGLSFAQRRLDEMATLKERHKLTEEMIDEGISEYRGLVSLVSREAQDVSPKDKEHALALMLNVEQEVGRHKNRMGDIDKKIAETFNDKSDSLVREIEDNATDFEIDLGIIASASVRNIKTKGAEERIRQRIDQSEHELERMAGSHGETNDFDMVSLKEAKTKTSEKKMKEAFEAVKKLERHIEERSKKQDRADDLSGRNVRGLPINIQLPDGPQNSEVDADAGREIDDPARDREND